MMRQHSNASTLLVEAHKICVDGMDGGNFLAVMIRLPFVPLQSPFFGVRPFSFLVFRYGDCDGHWMKRVG